MLQLSLGFAATYGIVGGNAGIICELYNVSGAITKNLLQYQYAMDYFEPRTNWPCEIPSSFINIFFLLSLKHRDTILVPYIRYDLQIVEPPEPGRAEFRKHFATKKNPNNWGKRRR